MMYNDGGETVSFQEMSSCFQSILKLLYAVLNVLYVESASKVMQRVSQWHGNVWETALCLFIL